MFSDGLNDLVDFFRTSLPFSMLYFVPLILLLTSDPRVSIMVDAAQEFQVYRMQQYDMPFGNHLGSRSNQISMEARTLNAAKPGAVSRRCVLIKLRELSLERYRLLVSQYAGAIIVLLPNKYDDEDKLVIKSIESQLLHEEVKLPVYFAYETDEWNKYYEYIENERSNQADTSAFQALVDSVVTNGFQFVINSPQSQQIVQSSHEFQAINLQGKLNGGIGLASASSFDDHTSKIANQNSKIPTIILTAHYDAFGIATSLSNGCDSNGSGVVALLELSRIFSYLYANLKTIPAVNILFLLTAEGKFNYHGIKKWIEEHSESNEIAGKVDLDDVLFALCLDSIGKISVVSASDEESKLEKIQSLFAHVSRPPKEGQASFEFLKAMENVAAKENIRFEMVHKKINLASEILAWEHERFSLNKIPALTISHFQSFKDSDRSTIADSIDSIDKKVLTSNIRLILHSIAQFIYKNENITNTLFSDDLDVSDEFISSWLERVCSSSRSASLLNKNHPLINNFFSHFNHYLQETVKYPVKMQSKEPEFVFYNEEQATLMIYSVKPAVFDLFLALLIASYLGAIYVFVLNFSQIFSMINRKFTLNQNGNKQKNF